MQQSKHNMSVKKGNFSSKSNTSFSPIKPAIITLQASALCFTRILSLISNILSKKIYR